ncbi:MAG: RNB domain-containing ribonuclease [Chloroflexi bacterium]|nr:RNB domain-containing ribonuclease [Chloroflexota bacterium]
MSRSDRAELETIARRVMDERGLWPDFGPEVLEEVAALSAVAEPGSPTARDLRALLWCSIDNDDSRDLDQLSVGEVLTDGAVRIRVAIADVDSLVPRECATDLHAAHNTTSVYPPGRVFPMLPERLSTDLTSLNPDEDRLAMVVEMDVSGDGLITRAELYRALVHNRAKLAYPSMGAWLAGEGPAPAALAAVPGLAENVRLQDSVAQRLRAVRLEHGALQLETIEGQVVFDGDTVRSLEKARKNRATQLIEDFMIAANGATARFLAAHGSPSIRRVVRSPKRWDRIVELAASRGHNLIQRPDSRALDAFLVEQRAADPTTFPDLSLAVIKLLGSGEYVAVFDGESAPGHFGLAVQDYAHSTAPNRRYSDLITQRLIKAVLDGRASPYNPAQLTELARQCTDQEDVATKVERLVFKSAAALLLRTRIGERFEAIVTGAAEKGTWVRLLDLPVEGKLVRGQKGLDVGDRVEVALLQVNVQRGFIDFARGNGR